MQPGCTAMTNRIQVGEMLLHDGVEAYKKEGPKFMQRLVAKQKARVKDSCLRRERVGGLKPGQEPSRGTCRTKPDLLRFPQNLTTRGSGPEGPGSALWGSTHVHKDGICVHSMVP